MHGHAAAGIRQKGTTVRHRHAWAPDAIDIERPAAARMYDYYLGGSSNFAVDRALAGYELIPPGLVNIIHWRPDLLDTRPDPLGGDVTRYSGYAAVGRRT